MSELLLLKKEDCKSCYKCIRECALKSIRFSERTSMKNLRPRYWES